ncbi:MAG TPA: tRNA uridine(34) 5-carboxymethylaminomethyl modification radical SAM/GNAT enzyme Elp3 [Thermoanaerobaculia bacterium]|nr:tRNA uridine(34) 5-carboxymethylaminomethyl modification radical SAM/GNAT enzyme Elp3 [Thermoanaerobaculia bacterium]
MTATAYPFAPEKHRVALRSIFAEIAAASGEGTVGEPELREILRRHPKNGRGFYSKSELVRGLRWLRRCGDADALGLPPERELMATLRMKPVRTRSGVAPVTVLTRPYPCPGKCIFCPSDVRMPKSYLSDEPGALRAGEHQFDPYRQTFARLLSLHHTGHPVDKVELIVLGGTWSFYPESYQLWFVQRCFDALADFGAGVRRLDELRTAVDFRRLEERIEGGRSRRSYNRVVADFVARFGDPERGSSVACWDQLAEAHARNEEAPVRCVGLSVETRPDRLDEAEAERIRRLGATKVQIGVQSLDDEVLAANRRGHDVAATRRAFDLLRQAGFKIQAHWMPNLFGSNPERDVEDFARLFDDPALRPDELKIYPCSLIESAELMAYWRAGRWRPYGEDELASVLVACMRRVPRYCRVTRVIRDIPGTDIVAGNRVTNFRQVVERELERRAELSRDIRAREVRELEIDVREVELSVEEYETSGGRECFLEALAPGDRLAGFLRLRLPERPAFLSELGRAAVIREVHVYGQAVALGGRERGLAQHRGLGRRLIDRARRLARECGYDRLAVISAVGTRGYYRRLGFADGELYQVMALASEVPAR